MKLKFLVAGLLAAASFAASAADQSVALNLTDVVSFKATNPVLDGGDDLISFSGLAAGVYDISITLSSQGVTWNQAATNLNGVVGSFSGSKLQFADFEYNGSTPFSLTLVGTKTAGAAKFGYSGDVSVSAVPEPETYGMLLGGLALMGVVARRKAKKSA
ncbi:MAG: FxDxF family PEP-CTERM protein [Pseudomonadota bacterium]